MSGRGKKAGAPKKKANGYKMPEPIPAGEIINDPIGKKKWRIGPSIGVGGFGEIYSACEHEGSPKKGSSYPFVIKIEPHENGPLFVEKHFYVRNANKDDIATYMKSKKLSSLGMPLYYGSGSHNFKGEKYRYLVLERYGQDVWKMFKEAGRTFPAPTVFQLGLQMLDVLEYIHSKGYVHADLKGANILMGLKKGTENQAYLVDFGLASRVSDKEFKPDPKCAHNGTIEYTSRDAHLGVATMRGDLEILGYNLLQWLVGTLPWEKSLAQPKVVQAMKEDFMANVRARLTKDYPDVPDVLEYIHSKGYVHADLKGANILMGLKKGTENQAYLVDFGLASRVSDKEFKPDPKCAHNGTIEYTSRDAHLGVATMRGDLEILGYNLLQWLVGTLPWEKSLAQPKVVQAMKEDFMANVRARLTKDYPDVPDALIKFFEYINTLKPKEQPDYSKCRQIFETYLKSEGKTRNSKLDFTPNKKGKTKRVVANDETDDKPNSDASKPKKGRKPKVPSESDENKIPTDSQNGKIGKNKKRKSSEPSVLVKVKKAKLAPKATPPVKKNHANIATQTSIEKRRSPRQVSFDSPLCAVFGDKKTGNGSINSSGDIFDDSFVIEEKKVKPKRKLLSKKEVIVKRVVKKKVTVAKQQDKSWKDVPTVVNGRSPPK